MVETPTTCTIRPLTLEELPLCAPFGRAVHAEKDVPGEFSIELFVQSWTLFLTRCNGVLLGMWVDDRLVGGIGGMITPDFYAVDPETGAPVLSATEFFLYLDPEYRKGDRWLQLVAQFRAFGRSKGATRYRIGAPIKKSWEFDRAVRTVKGRVLDRAARVLAYKYRKMGLRPIDFGFEGSI